MGYGLTRNQSLIFSTLLQNKTSLTTKQISDLSDIARETVYKNLPILNKMGLVEKIICYPVKYESIQLKYAISILSAKKNRAIKKLEELATQIMSSSFEKVLTDDRQSNQFILVPKLAQVEHRYKNALENTKDSFCVMSTWNRHMRAVKVYKSFLEDLLSRGVKCRVLVTEKPKDIKLQRLLTNFVDNPNISFKFIDKTNMFVLSIFDDNEMCLVIEPQLDLLQSPALWSYNKSLILALTACFNSFWENG